MKRIFTCIVCPNGCDIMAEYEDDEVISIEGATCLKGEEYVRQELIDPQRTIASSVPVDGGVLPLVSVRLDRPIPKRDIFQVMNAINQVRLQAPAAIGQVVLADVCGLSANVIVTKNVAAKQPEHLR